MAVQFGEIYLYSHNPEKLFHFLSFLLDVQASEYNEQKIRFNFQTINFVIKPCETKRLSRLSYFSLTVEDAHELDDLKRNIEFYYYKEGNLKHSITQLDNGIEFTDPDDRKWSIFVGNNYHFSPVKQEANISNVRNC